MYSDGRFTKMRRQQRIWCHASMTALLLLATSLRAELTETQVLLVINTNSASSLAIAGVYTNLHPDVHVVRIGASTAASITRTNFNTQIRDPIRAFLTNNSLQSTVVAVVTTKGLPRAIAQVGPGSSFSSGLANYASVDADLTMLWQELAASGTDSGSVLTNLLAGLAQNYVVNPFHNTNATMASFTRANILTAKSFAVPDPIAGAGYTVNTNAPTANQFTPGDMYLVNRLDAFTVADVTNSILRTRNIVIDKTQVTVVLDRDGNNWDGNAAGRPFSQVPDFAPTRDALTNAGFEVIFDDTDTHITNASNPVIAYAGYGNNAHVPHDPQYIQEELQFTYAPGAMFNTYESFNGSDFENPAHGTQGMIADWLLVGGSLGVAHVTEPFTFPVADNVIMMVRMLTGGVSWAEAAWAALPVISWQNIVIGDPLAKFTFVATNDPPSLSVFPDSLAVVDTDVGETNSASFLVQNVGNGTLTGAVTVSAPFAVTDGSPFSLAVGETTNVTVRFVPVASGIVSNDVIFTSNGGGSTNLVTGRGVDAPVADFTASPTNGLAPLGVTFTDLSTGSITNRFWDFGDGGSTNTSSTNVLHTYNSAGTNTVTLIVSGPDGASTNTKTGFIVATNLPPAQLSVTPTGIAFGSLLVGLTNTQSFSVVNSGGVALTGTASVAGPFAIASGSPFNVSPGTTGTVDVSFLPVAEGSFSNGVVFASNGGGSTNPVTGTGITLPVAGFSASPTNGTPPLVVTFSDESAGTITNRFWDFGDGGTTNTLATNLVHTYTAAGTNSVSLVVSGPAGASTNTKTGFIVVTNIPPAALAVAPANVAFGSVVLGQTNTLSFSVINSGGLTLTGTATVGGPFAIAGGSPFNVSPGATGTVEVSFLPVAEGSFSNNVLFASNGGGSTNPVTGTGITPGQLLVTPATIDFGTIATGATTQASFVLTNTGGTILNGTAVASGAPFTIASGTPFSLDALEFTNVVVAFTPTSANSVTGSVVFASDGGNFTNAVTGTGAMVPLAGFTASPTNGLAPLGVTFNDTSAGTITNRFWDFGDGATTNTLATNLVHTYTSVGTNTVTLVVSGPVGVSTSIAPGLIVVTNIPAQLIVSPTNLVDFGLVIVGQTNSQSYQVINGGQAALTGAVTVTAPFAVTAGSPFTIAGSQTGLVTVGFIPTGEGAFTNDVLFASNGGSLTNLVTGQAAETALATFTADPTVGLVPLTVTFTDTSTGTITNRFWDFGDGGTTNLVSTNVVHIYNATGTNTVTLIVSGPAGISTNIQADLIRVTNRIPIVASFTPSVTSGVAPLAVAFSNNTSGTVAFHNWSFGDGGISTNVNPTHIYSNAGVFTVVLTAGGDAGTNTLTQPNLIVVSNAPPVDVLPPSLVITFPINNQGFTNENLTVTATAADPSGVTNVTVNGVPATFDGTNWSQGILLALGTNLISVIATDGSPAMNAATQTVNAVFSLPPSAPDTNDPIVTITAPSHGAILSNRFVDVAGTVTDDVGVTSLVLTNSRGGVFVTNNLAGTNWSFASVPLKLGTNVLFATATDTSTNRARTSVTVVRIYTNYVNTTFRATKAKLTLDDAPDGAQIVLSAVFNPTGIDFDPVNQTFEVLFGDFEEVLATNSLSKLKYKAKASPSNAVTSVKISFVKRTISIRAEGLALTNRDPFMAAVAFGGSDLGPDAITFPAPTNAFGKFSWSFGSQLPNFDQFFLGKSKLDIGSFKLTGTIHIIPTPNVLTNEVCFGIGPFDEMLPTNGWTKASGNVFTYTPPSGFAGVVQQLVLDFDKGTWSASGTGADLSFLLNNPATDVRIEIGEFGASYPAELESKGSKFQY